MATNYATKLEDFTDDQISFGTRDFSNLDHELTERFFGLVMGLALENPNNYKKGSYELYIRERVRDFFDDIGNEYYERQKELNANAKKDEYDECGPEFDSIQSFMENAYDEHQTA